MFRQSRPKIQLPIQKAENFGLIAPLDGPTMSLTPA